MLKSSMLIAMFLVAEAAMPAGIASGAEGPTTTLSSISGQSVTIPADAKRVNVVVFVRPDQPQSLEAIQQIQSVAEKTPPELAVILVVCAEEAKLESPWPIVLDPKYELSGRMNVHAWPTTLVLKSDGGEVGHLAGLKKSFASDLSAHIDLAAGRVDEATMQQNLANPQVVTDSPQQMAARHLRVAEQHLSKGHLPAALSEIESGLTIKSDDAHLLMLKARVLLEQNEAAQALAVLDQVGADDIPAWQIKTQRARILIAQENWDEARATAAEALKLNPKPAEAHYLNGEIAAHDQDWPRAAEQFKLAYESLEK